MTKQYLEDNLLYIIIYQRDKQEELTGKQIQEIEDRNEDWYSDVNRIYFAAIQKTEELQKIVDNYYRWLKETSYELTWYNYIQSLLKEGVLNE